MAALKHSLTQAASIVGKNTCIMIFMDISKRIETAREHAGLDRNQLAAACKISYQAVQQWEVGRTKPSAKALMAIAKATATNADWLINGIGEMQGYAIGELVPDYNNVDPIPALRLQVPLISWVQAGDFCESVDLFQPGDADEWMPCPVPHSKHTYALRVRGPSMEPKFHEGEIVVIDPEAAALSGRYVVAKKTGSQEVTLKQLIMDGSETYLKAANPNWPDQIIRITEEWIICGVVICKIEVF